MRVLDIRWKRPSHRRLALSIAMCLYPVVLIVLLTGVFLARAVVTGSLPGPFDVLWMRDLWLWFCWGCLTVGAAGIIREIVFVLFEPRRIDVVR